MSELRLYLISQVNKPWETKLYILNIYFLSHFIQGTSLVVCFQLSPIIKINWNFFTYNDKVDK